MQRKRRGCRKASRGGAAAEMFVEELTIGFEASKECFQGVSGHIDLNPPFYQTSTAIQCLFLTSLMWLDCI